MRANRHVEKGRRGNWGVVTPEIQYLRRSALHGMRTAAGIPPNQICRRFCNRRLVVGTVGQASRLGRRLPNASMTRSRFNFAHSVLALAAATAEAPPPPPKPKPKPKLDDRTRKQILKKVRTGKVQRALRRAMAEKPGMSNTIVANVGSPRRSNVCAIELSPGRKHLHVSVSSQ